MVPEVQEPETHRIYPGDSHEIQNNVLTSHTCGAEDQVSDTNGWLSIKPSRENDNSGLVIQFFADLEHITYLLICSAPKWEVWMRRVIFNLFRIGLTITR